MRLRRLEIVGFKSFADRARLCFGDGITGVVGPNGCGKSNVVDAIRWCMGEMSAKHLRGRAMQDVIFAGSDSRGPLGLAEVTLTFENDGDVPPAYAAYAEIAVTRRLHRDGTSEYHINKVPVRLRDITDLFLGTGVGTRAYSIIEQGRIGFVVNARPEDRRTLIEEVAGITKFKVRKKAAERRMEATEQNLKRVEDIIAELDRQLSSLRRQAKKAERYKKVKAQMRDLDLRLAAMEVLRLAALHKAQGAIETELNQRLGDAHRGIESEESGLESDRVSLMEQEERLQLEQQAAAEIEAKLAALERDLEHWRRQLGEARQRNDQTTAEVADARLSIEAAKHERAELEQQVGEHEVFGVEGRRQMADAARDVEDAQSGLRDIDEQVEALRRDALVHVQAATEQRALAAGLERRRVDLRFGMEEAASEQEELSHAKAEAERREADLAARSEQVAGELAEWSRRLEGVRQEHVAVGQKLDASQEQVAALKDELSVRRSRLASLQEIVRRLEGYSDGVRTLMATEAEAGRAKEPAVPGILGLVAEVLEVPPAYERAIEAVLGERLQYLVVDGHPSAVAAVQHLKDCSGGRSGFVPSAARPASRPGSVEHAGVLGSALSLIHVEPDHQPVARALLEDVALVRDAQAALAVWSATPDGCPTLVTLDGEVLEPTGTFVGGSGDGAGLLATRREIRELTDVVAALEAELATARGRLEELERVRLQLDVDSQQLDKDIRATELEKLELAKDLEAARAEKARVGERLATLERDGLRRAEELSTLDDEEAAALAAVAAAEAQQQDLEARLAELQEARQIRAAKLSAQADDLTALKVQLASRDEKLAAGRTTFERLGRTISDLQARIERGRVTIEETAALITDLEVRIDAGGADAVATAEQAQQRRESLSATRAAYDAQRTRIAEQEQTLRSRRRDGDALQQDLVDVRMELQRLDLARQQVVERVAERHDLDLLKVVGDYHMAPQPDETDLKRRGELERAIKSMGAINLTAIEECAEVEARHSFLVGQRDDLVGALEALKRAIQRINRTSRERFKAAFEAVDEMFRKVYPRLFRGGEARLELVSSDDLLDAGVDIFAQPPGKKLQSVGLLSGGEKALTATALVFSIFLIKPSPFCILDEVDAPLDDANVGRFNEMLREISKLSQFVVITHNKGTMGEADRLYGITMEEPGMSRVVSVDLEQAEEEAAA